MNIQIGKLYQVNCHYELVATPSWKPTIHGVSHYRKDTLIIPLEIQTENDNEDKMSIKVLTQNRKIGWLMAYKGNVHKYLTLVNAQ
jgi:hypothetical protein